MASKYGSLSGCSIGPEHISMRQLLNENEFANALQGLCAGEKTFIRVFEYTENTPALLNCHKETDQLLYPTDDVNTLINQIKNTGQPQNIRLESGLSAIGSPIWLNHKGETFLKGCFVFIAPYANTNETHIQLVHLIANFYSDKISGAFEKHYISKNNDHFESDQKMNDEKLIDAINKSDLRMLLVDKDMRIIWQSSFINNKYANSVVGGYCYKVLHDRDSICNGCIAKQVFETGTADTSIINFYTPSEKAMFKLTSGPVMDENGKVKQVLQIAQDLMIPHSIQTQLNHHKRLIDQSEDYMASIDNTGKLIAINRKMVSDLGYAAEDIIGKNIRHFISKKSIGNLQDLVQGANKYGISIGTILIKKKDGTDIIANGSLTYNKGLGIYECVCRDISYKQKIEEELREKSEQLLEQNQKVVKAMQERDNFLRSVSHELRSPLTAIMGFSELLIDDENEPLTKTQKRAVEKILGSTQRLLNLVNDLLDLSKLDAKKESVELTSVELGTFLPQIIESMMPLAKDRGLDIKIEVSEDIPSLRTDESKLSQVIVNLVSNAIKFTNNGYIRVTARKKCSQLSISVEDTGIGIPEDQLPHIFKEFHQIKQSKNREGTGLGLAISHKLVSLLGGKISVSSKVGEGSIFTVYLPLTPEKL